MPVNIPTLIAETISFFFFIWIFHQCIWKKLIHLVDLKRKKIISSLQKAENACQKVKEFEKKCQEIVAHAQNKADQIIQDAELRAKKITQEQKKITQEKCQALLLKAQEEIMNEQSQMEQKLKAHVSVLVVESIQQLIKKRTSDSKENHKWQKFFIEQLPKS